MTPSILPYTHITIYNTILRFTQLTLFSRVFLAGATSCGNLYFTGNGDLMTTGTATAEELTLSAAGVNRAPSTFWQYPSEFEPASASRVCVPSVHVSSL